MTDTTTRNGMPSTTVEGRTAQLNGQHFDFHPAYDGSAPSWLVGGTDTPLTRVLGEAARMVHDHNLSLGEDDRFDLRWLRKSLEAGASLDVILGDSILRMGVLGALGNVSDLIEQAGIPAAHPRSEPLHAQLRSAANEIATTYTMNASYKTPAQPAR